MAQPVPQQMTDDDLEQALQDLLADLPDEDLEELAALAEAMHETADGGDD